MRRKMPALLALAAVIFYAGSNASCSGWGSGVRVFLEEPFPEKLSSWRLFEKSSAPLRPNVGLIPYDLNTPLFSDYAAKYRFVWMPAGQAATYNEDEAFTFPVGTILSKTFAFPEGNDKGKGEGERLIETRLLVRVSRGGSRFPTSGTKLKRKPCCR